MILIDRGEGKAQPEQAAFWTDEGRTAFPCGPAF